MEIDSIFSSSYGEQRWVHHISKNFQKEIAIDITNVPICVFNVPKSITAVKPEAYIPHLISLGPYHHMRPELFQMERYKVSVVRSFLNPNQIINFQHLFIDKLIEIEPTIRACYHKYLDLDDETLAWIIAIDGLFLLHLLGNYANINYFEPRKLKQEAILCRDVMVLENQIPVILLKEIRKSHQLSFGDDGTNDAELFFMLKGFCQTHSPLKLAWESQFLPETSPLHLLDLMYHLIVNHRTTKQALEKESPKKAGARTEMMKEDLILNVGEILEVGMNLGIGKKVLEPIQVIRNMPWEKISNLLGHKMVEEDNNNNNHNNNLNPIVEEIIIPSVSKLCTIAGIKFSHTIGGIRDIKFEEEEPTLYIPIITLNSNSEVVLRNLVAYELATSDSALEFAQYVDLMSGIIDTAEDARLLREKGIIKGNLSNEEIANLFNGMNKSSGKRNNNIIEKINDYYNKRPVVKAYRSIKKRVYDSWKILTLVSTGLLLLLFILNSFCEVYDCPHFFGRSS